MTALSITPANVVYSNGPVKGDQIAGEAFGAGVLLYYKASDGKWYKAQCDGTVAEAGQDGTGIALSSADVANARVSVGVPGAIVTVGAGLAGVVYCAGRVAGTLVPVADLLSTDKVTPVALGIGSNQLQLMYAYNAGAVLA